MADEVDFLAAVSADLPRTGKAEILEGRTVPGLDGSIRGSPIQIAVPV